MSVSSVLSIIAPQFDAVANRSEFISLATRQVNECWFNDKYEDAVAYLAAHLIAINSSARGDYDVGAVSSKKEGDLAISFSSIGSNTDGDLGQTKYGVQYQRMLESSNFAFGVTGGGFCGC